jgi:hypothetical protein
VSGCHKTELSVEVDAWFSSCARSITASAGMVASTFPAVVIPETATL